jgi:thiamine pyrophosphate-dependent acetolactate synthase large subunit-like protein
VAVKRIEALALISQQFSTDPVVFTCGATCREMAATDRRDNHLYVVDSMGLVCPIVLGLSLGLEGRPGRRVVGVEGDGGMLTNLNALTTIGYLGPENLLLIVLDNQQYASTGGQPTFTTKLDLGAIAASCGLRTWKADDLETLKESIAEAARTPGPGFIHMKIAPGNSNVPLLLDDPVTLGDRFTRWLSSASGG